MNLRVPRETSGEAIFLLLGVGVAAVEVALRPQSVSRFPGAGGGGPLSEVQRLCQCGGTESGDIVK